MQLIKLIIAVQTDYNFQLFNFTTFALILSFYIKPEKISQLVLKKYEKIFVNLKQSGYIELDSEFN
jgi:hypothetical protein